MSQPKLSICIPTYNRATYLVTLLKHLEELVEQLPFGVEVVISDNASSDNTLELLEEASERLPLLILHQSENLEADRRGCRGACQTAKDRGARIDRRYVRLKPVP